MQNTLSDIIVIVTVAGGTMYFLERATEIGTDIASSVNNLIHTKTYQLTDEEYELVRKVMREGDDYEKEIAIGNIMKDAKKGWEHSEINTKKKTLTIRWVKRNANYEKHVLCAKMKHEAFEEMEKTVKNFFEPPKLQVKAEVEKPKKLTRAEKKAIRSERAKLMWKKRHEKEAQLIKEKGAGYVAKIKNLKKARRAKARYAMAY